jgi:hypothetical protein
LNALLTESLALLIAMVFAAAALSKLWAWRELPGVVHNFRLLPSVLVVPVALVLPPLEIAIAAGLLMPGARSPAAACAALLFVVFAAALAMNLHRGRRQIDCGCFRSDLKQPISLAVVLRNLLLAVAALPLIPAGAMMRLSPPAWAVAASGAATLFFCYLSVGIIFQAPPPSYEDNFHANRSVAD